jgi:predicted permease
VQALVAAVADRIPRGEEIGVGAATIAATIAVTAAVGALMALIPLIHVSRGSVAQAVREEGRGGTAGRSARAVRRTLVTAQVAFAFMLLIGAGLLLASFQALLRVDTGFQAGGVITGRLYLPESRYGEDSAIVALQQRYLERVRALPGVVAAGLNNAVPFTGSYGDSVIFAEGYVAPPGESVVSPAQNIVTPGYFEAMRIPLRRGRFIDARDTSESPAAIVIDDRLARRFWGDADPIGRRMWMPGSAEEVNTPGPLTRWFTIVGVVGTVKQRGLASENERLGAYYFPHTQQPARTMTIVARTAADPLGLTPALRRELAALDPEVPLFGVQTMEGRIEESVAGRRTAMLLAIAFGLIALLLATVGIYGVLAYQVTQRTREIGIRLALGSRAGQVFALVLREGALLVGAGFGFGLAGVFALRRALEGELYGVGAFEPSVVATVAGLLAIVALAACILPARRASRIDPVVALAE